MSTNGRRLTGWMVALAAFGVATGAQAAVHAKFELAHDAYLRFEDVKAIVTVHNDTDEPFIVDRMGEEGHSRLHFEVRHRGEVLVPRTNSTQIARLLVLPDETQNFMVDLADLYDLAGEGRYFVRVVAEQSGEAWQSPEQMIDVVPGMRVTSTSRMVPGYTDRLRTYSLRYWTREGNEYLFLTVDEEETGYNYGVFPLGTLVRVRQPSIDVDRRGNILIWHQCRADCYLRTTLKSTPDDVVMLNQDYYTEDGRPYPGTVRQPKAIKAIDDNEEETPTPKKHWWQFWKRSTPDDERPAAVDTAPPAGLVVPAP